MGLLPTAPPTKKPREGLFGEALAAYQNRWRIPKAKPLESVPAEEVTPPM